MLKIILYLVIIYFLLKYIRSYMRVSYEKFVIRSFLKKLDPEKYRILTNIRLHEYHVRKWANDGLDAYSKTENILNMDYVIVSIYGVFVIKILNCRQRYCGIRGSVNAKTWIWTHFGNFYIPILGSVGNRHEKIRNPLFETKLFMASAKKELKHVDLKKMHPIVIIIPKIRVAEISGNENDYIIWCHTLKEIIREHTVPKISPEEMNELFQDFLNFRAKKLISAQ